MTKRVWFITFLLALIVSGVRAQVSAPTLTLIQDVSIGFDSPLAATLQPDAEAVWVVFSDDARTHYSLRSFSTFTGEPLGDPLPLFDDPASNLFPNPVSFSLALMPDGMLRLVLHSLVTHFPVTYTINPETGESTTNPEADAQLIAFISQYTDYHTPISYSPGQSFAIVSEGDNFTLLDMEVSQHNYRLRLDALSTGFAGPGVRFYVLVASEPGSTENTLRRYATPAGEVIRSVPTQASGRIFPGTGGHYIGFNAASGAGEHSIIGVIDPESGAISNLLSEAMPPFRLDHCAAVEGTPTPSADVITGWQVLRDVVWMPNGVIFITVSDYVGGCASRLRIYRVDGGEDALS